MAAIWGSDTDRIVHTITDSEMRSYFDTIQRRNGRSHPHTRVLVDLSEVEMLAQKTKDAIRQRNLSITILGAIIFWGGMYLLFVK